MSEAEYMEDGADYLKDVKDRLVMAVWLTIIV